jgi:hypothetical protein
MSRQSTTEKQHESEYTFMRAYTDLVDELAVTYKADIYCQLIPTLQKGVVHVSLSALSSRTDERSRTLARVQGNYPDGRTLVLSAKLFQLANSLLQMVESVRGEEYRRLMSAAEK